MPPLPIARIRDRLDSSGPQPVRPADLSSLVGAWANFDAGSTGIARLKIADRSGALIVRAWGTGTPEPHDWGEVAGDPFTDGVGLHIAVAFRVDYDLGFARVRLACYLNKRLLVVDAYSVFVDGSGRAPCFRRDHFYVP